MSPPGTGTGHRAFPVRRNFRGCVFPKTLPPNRLFHSRAYTSAQTVAKVTFRHPLHSWESPRGRQRPRASHKDRRTGIAGTPGVQKPQAPRVLEPLGRFRERPNANKAGLQVSRDKPGRWVDGNLVPRLATSPTQGKGMRPSIAPRSQGKQGDCGRVAAHNRRGESLVRKAAALGIALTTHHLEIALGRLPPISSTRLETPPGETLGVGTLHGSI